MDTNSILQVIDFTTNLVEDTATFILRDPLLFGGGSNLNLWAYVGIFSNSAWFILLGGLVCFSAVISVFRLYWKREKPSYVIFIDR